MGTPYPAPSAQYRGSVISTSTSTARSRFHNLSLILLALLLASPALAPHLAAGQEDASPLLPTKLQSVPPVMEYQAGPGPLGQAVVKWRVPLEDDLYNFQPTNVLLVDSTLYVGDQTGTIYAVEAESGAVRILTTGFDSNSYSYLHAHGQYLYWRNSLNGSGSQVFAIDRTSGEIAWVSAIEGGVGAFSLSSDDNIFVQKDDVLHALDAQSGAIDWTIQTLGNTRSFAITDDAVYVSSYGWIQAFNRSTQQELWRVAVENTSISQMLVFADRLYARSEYGQLFALLTRNGQERMDLEPNCEQAWAFENQVACDNSISTLTPTAGWAFSNGSIFFTAAGNQSTFAALDYGVYGAPAVSGGFIYLTSSDGMLVALGGNAGQDAIEAVALAPGVGIEVGKTVTITGDDVVLRGAPSSGAVEITALPEGTEVTVLAGPLDGEGGEWWQVSGPDGASGYVPGANLATILQ